MKKGIKKIIIFLVVVGILVGAGFGGVFAYWKYQSENLTAEVYYVSNLSWRGGFYDEDGQTCDGNILDEYAQNIYPEDKTIKEVLVNEGDSVDVGTPLLVYDTTQEEIQLEMKELDIQGINNKIILTNRELERLKKVTPVPDNYIEGHTITTTTTTTNTQTAAKKDRVVMQVQQKVGNAYNYIDKSSKPYTGDGTPEEPYRFVCTPECYVMGAYLNKLVKNEEAAAFEIWSGNSMEMGNLLSCWTVDGSDMTAVEENSKWLVSTQEIMQEEVYEDEPEEEEQEDDTNDETEEEVYTVSELKRAIEEKERDLKDLDIDKRSADLELEKEKKKIEKATVVSNIKGIVTSVSDPENLPTDGSPFMKVQGASGVYVQGSVSELMLDTVKVGQKVTLSSWNSGQTYTATITEISDYPMENDYGSWGSNPNASYYPFTAYIENSQDMEGMGYVIINLSGDASVMEESDVLTMDKAYVREENGRYYVLKVGEDERLVKQYLQTGQATAYSIEIQGGLTESDRIAFPYGKTAKEGILAKDPSDM